MAQEIRVLDYYECVGQVLAFHVNWMREKGYEKAIHYLPHDGANANNVTGKSYADHLRDAGFTVEPPVKNQGKGAAMMRIEALRRLGPQLWFNEASTEAGRDALGFYHEKQGRPPQRRPRAGTRLVKRRRRRARADGDLLGGAGPGGGIQPSDQVSGAGVGVMAAAWGLHVPGW